MVAEFKMNQEKLKQLQAQVRIGGKGTARRKKKVVHRTATTDDKKLQSSLKKLSGDCQLYSDQSIRSSQKHHFCSLCSSDRCVEVDEFVSGCGGLFLILLTSIRFKHLELQAMERTYFRGSLSDLILFQSTTSPALRRST